MDIEVHLPTLFFISILLNAVFGSLLWWIHCLRRRQLCFLYWSWSCLSFAAGGIVASARLAIDSQFLTVFIAHSLLGLSPLLIFMGLQSFSNRPEETGRRAFLIASVSFGLYLSALMITYSLSELAARAITAIFSALVFGAALHKLSIIESQVRMPLRVLRVLFATHSVLMLIQSLVIISYTLNGFINDLSPILRMILINHMLLAMGTALTLPLMVFSQSERKLRNLADRDELTGLHNRRSLFREGIRAFADSKAEDSPLAVLMLDLDHFKRINDTWGHASGDEALRVVSRALMSEAAKSDVVGRIGGEEFTIVIPLTNSDSLHDISSRILTTILTDGAEINGKPMKLSTSIGGITRRPHHATFQDMVREADSALFAAKKAGRNRAEIRDESGESSYCLPI